MKIPVYRPQLTQREKQYVNECLDSSWISSKGKFISEFEERFASYIGVKHATTVSNGTVALHLALEALGIRPGDEVIVPAFTYIASVNAIHYTGATPIFVDSLESTWQLDPKDVEKKISPRTRAIMPVHLYGHPCDMGAIRSMTAGTDIHVVEDCAEAFGSKVGEKYVGSFGDVSTFSFFGNKTITTGEGGMVTTDDTSLYDRLKKLKSQGLAGHREYWHDIVGYNYRMTNICAAIGLAQLERADSIIQKKREIAAFYREQLKRTPVKFHDETQGVTHSYWMVSILTPRAEDRDPLRAFLAEQGVETRPAFYPAHTMPMYCKRFEKHPVATSLAARGINLPSFPDLTESEVTLVCRLIGDYFAKRN